MVGVYGRDCGGIVPIRWASSDRGGGGWRCAKRLWSVACRRTLLCSCFVRDPPMGGRAFLLMCLRLRSGRRFPHWTVPVFRAAPFDGIGNGSTGVGVGGSLAGGV